MPTPEELAEQQAQEEAAKAAAAAEPKPEEILDPRFKTIEEQAKAYKEAEKKMTQSTQEAAELRRQNQELLARQQQPPVATPPPDYNAMFWQNPAEVIGKIVEGYVAPFVEDRFELQKGRYAQDPNFKRYEPQIDQMVKMQPELKKQPGIVDKLYKVVRAMEFDPDTERKRIEEEVRAQIQGKQINSVEGTGTPSGAAPSQNAELDDKERAVALKFYPDMKPQDAFKRYGDNKIKSRQGAM